MYFRCRYCSKSYKNSGKLSYCCEKDQQLVCGKCREKLAKYLCQNCNDCHTGVYRKHCDDCGKNNLCDACYGGSETDYCISCGHSICVKCKRFDATFLIEHVLHEYNILDRNWCLCKKCFIKYENPEQ